MQKQSAKLRKVQPYKIVASKRDEQQPAAMVLRARHLLVRWPTRTTNEIRHHLA